jgi:nucleoside-diphosphate-sugar epimerase
MWPNHGSVAGKRILVTGASGFLGAALVRRLVSRGAVVAAVSRTHGRLLGEEGFQFLPCDLTELPAATKAFACFGPEILFHFAAHPDGAENYSQACHSIQTNTLITLNTLESFRLAKGELFVYGDSSKVYGECEVPYRANIAPRPLSSYGIAKLAGWELCELYRRLHRISTVSLRPTIIYGPRQSYNLVTYVVNCVLSGKTQVVLDGGSQTRDPLYIDDATAAFLSVAERGMQLQGKIINLGGGNEFTIRELTEIMLQLMGVKLEVVVAKERVRPTDTRRSHCDNAESTALLGWKPMVGLRKGLLRTIQYLLEKQNIPLQSQIRHVAIVGQ